MRTARHAGAAIATAAVAARNLLTGSLLAAIVLHAVLDLVNGFTMYRVWRGSAVPSDL